MYQDGYYKQNRKHVGKDVEKLEHLCRADGNVGAAVMENNMVVPQKIKPRIAIYAAIPLMGT